MRNTLKVMLCLVCLSGTSFAGLTLYMGAGGANLIGIVQTNGASAGSVQVINTSYAANGIAAGNGLLYVGDPETNTLRTINPAGSSTGTVTGGFPSGCCGESMYYDGTFLWHVHYSSGSAGEIEKLNPTTGTVITAYQQPTMVGITSINGTFWISQWDTGDVGTWNPGTNTFTPVFNTGGESFPGGLAYDPVANILWIGNGDTNSVVPYTLTGTPL